MKYIFWMAPAKPLNEDETLALLTDKADDHSLFVLDTSTPSIKSDVNLQNISNKSIRMPILFWLGLTRRHVQKRHWAILRLWML